ncbi:hypothetical protein PR048_032420 [Dryococelus australis]|uniref:Uncharacterized protein n=1 Tax=Dryococelus australis TaxID=614101 RepID=A0ABQ9G501_9NEOP|nr:hypothetical protein PR048_032420 [Dryococelus australis]
MRVIEVSIKQRRNERRRTGHPRENPPTNSINRHDSHKRNSGVTRPAIESGSPGGANGPVSRAIPSGAFVAQWIERFQVGPQWLIYHGPHQARVSTLCSSRRLPYVLPGLAPRDKRFSATTRGATVVWRIEYSPPTNGNRVRLPVGSHPGIFACGNRAGRCRCSAGFLGDLPFPPPSHSGACSILASFTLIGSQDLAVKSRPNIFTHPLSVCHTHKPKMMWSDFRILCMNQKLTYNNLDSGLDAAEPGRRFRAPPVSGRIRNRRTQYSSDLSWRATPRRSFPDSEHHLPTTNVTGMENDVRRCRHPPPPPDFFLHHGQTEGEISSRTRDEAMAENHRWKGKSGLVLTTGRGGGGHVYDRLVCAEQLQHPALFHLPRAPPASRRTLGVGRWAKYQLGSPLVDDRPIINSVKYRLVSGVIWTNRNIVICKVAATEPGVCNVIPPPPPQQSLSCRDDRSTGPGSPPGTYITLPVSPGTTHRSSERKGRIHDPGAEPGPRTSNLRLEGDFSPRLNFSFLCTPSRPLEATLHDTRFRGSLCKARHSGRPETTPGTDLKGEFPQGKSTAYSCLTNGLHEFPILKYPYVFKEQVGVNKLCGHGFSNVASTVYTRQPRGAPWQ